jgi:signal transduction histidine kinase
MAQSILIVDDSQDDQLLNRRALRDIDCEVKVAPTIAAGLALAAENAFDAVLLDYNLPDGNGLEFMACLKIAHAGSVPPVIMLTGSGNESVAVEAIKAGAYDYLIKTVDGQHRKLLSVVVQRVMREHALRMEKQEAERQLQLAAAALSRNNEALRRSNEELQHFAHMAAHDLQAPLNAIAGCTQLIQDECAGKLSERGESCLGFVLDNTRRMQTLIQDLLSYARLDSQGRPCELADLGKIFDEVLFILATPISQANAQVSCGDLPVLKVDRQQIYQLLMNLIQNGLKYNREAIPRVRVSATREGREWVFAVEDNGIGIDPRYHGQVFEIFRRLHSSGAYPGSGIGLAICRRIVDRHGGRIWVASQEGKGSTFYFTLPADSPEHD